MSLSPEFLLAAPVVDIDGTVFIQGAIFLTLFFILGPALFKPWLEVRARRAERIDGALVEAERLNARAGQTRDEYDASVAAARDQAILDRSSKRKAAEGEGGVLVAAAREEAASTLEKERARMDGEAAAARQTLESRIDELAGEITTKVLGRSA